jgi:hypothetical protein
MTAVSAGGHGPTGSGVSPGNTVSPGVSTADPVEQAKAAIEYCYEQGWTDGLPVVPATRGDVEACLAAAGRDGEEIIGSQRHLGRSVTVAQAAANAIMAGCRPEYFPVVLAAWQAVCLERASRGAWQSTSGPAPMLVVNGPVRSRLGINAAGGVFGPGFRANATIPRAIGLIVRNGYGIHPQELEQATQGLPGRWSVCIGENEEMSPWEPLSAVGGVAAGTDAVSAILIRTCEYVDNRSTDSAEAVLTDFADSLARIGAYVGGPHSSGGLALGPEHAQLLGNAGYGRADVQQWLFEHAVRSRAEMVAAGKGEHAAADLDHGGQFRLLPAAEDIPIIVAGAANAAMSMVFRPFGWAPWSRQSVPVSYPEERS